MITTPPQNLSCHLGSPIIMSWWRLLCTGNASTTPRKPLPSETYGPALKCQWGDFWMASISPYCFLHSRVQGNVEGFFQGSAHLWSWHLNARETISYLYSWHPVNDSESESPYPEETKGLYMAPSPLNSSTLETSLTRRGKRVKPAITNQRFNS